MVSGNHYKSIILISIISLVLLISVTSTTHLNKQGSNLLNPNPEIIQNSNELNQLDFDVNPQNIDESKLQLFSHSNLQEIEDGYALDGVGVQVLFSNRIIFNIGSESVEMLFRDSNPLIPQYTANLDDIHIIDIVLPGERIQIINNDISSF